MENDTSIFKKLTSAGAYISGLALKIAFLDIYLAALAVKYFIGFFQNNNNDVISIQGPLLLGNR